MMMALVYGSPGIMTWEALAKYASEQSGGQLFVAISADMIAKGQTKAPNGFDWTTLLADFADLGGPVISMPKMATKQLTTFSFEQALTLVGAGHILRRADTGMPEISPSDITANDWIIVF